ncbi:MAG: cobalt transporter [Clostridia bacterium]|nr:cobalt transporter [Clostridia bacterium]
MGGKKWLTLCLIVLFAGAIIVGLAMGQSFSGMDEKVNSKINELAIAAGAGERAPFINTDQGDLLLFLFLLSGLVVGFYLGYQWRRIFGKTGEKL